MWLGLSLPELERRRNCAVNFEARSKWSNYLSVLVEAEDMSPWTGTTEEPSSRTLTRYSYSLILNYKARGHFFLEV